MKIPLRTPFVAALVAAVASPSLVHGQKAEVCESELVYKFDSGETRAVSTTIRPEEAAGSPWIQLDLSYTELASNAELVLSGSDGATETLTAAKLALNGWSAVFPGDRVDVSLVTPGNVFRGSGQASHVVVTAVKAGVCGERPPASICGTTDDREPSTDVRNGRIGGCTGWLISENVFLQAGHCGAPSSSTRIHFTYGVGNAAPEDQYAVDVDSYVSSDDFPSGTKYGHDFGIGRLLPNSVTGLLPGDAQSVKCGGNGCGWYDLGAVPGSTAGITMRVTGYGTAAIDSRSQKTHTGGLTNIVANAGAEQYYLQYNMDTTGGNSGSPAINENTGEAIGIHTHGGCSETGGANSGTRIDHPRLAPLIDFYLQTCTIDDNCDDGDSSNGVEMCIDGECVYGTPPTMAPTPCVGGIYLDVNINTDNYPAETSYVLTDTCTQTQVASVGAGNFAASGTAYTDKYCVDENHAFQFQINDSYGDGMCCSYGTGSYTIDYMGQTHTSPTGGAFGSGETITFGTCGVATPGPTPGPTAPATPPPTPQPTTAPPTPNPTPNPTSPPTLNPTTAPPTTAQPTSPPTRSPSTSPSTSPTTAPPSTSPTKNPTNAPTKQPTDAPTPVPTTPPPTPPPTNFPTPPPTTAQPTSAVDCSTFTQGGRCKEESQCQWTKGSCTAV